MVTHLVSGLSYGFVEVIFPTWSPQPSPILSRRIVPDVCEKNFFMEFSCLDKPLGRIAIKIRKGAGEAGLAFECLVTGKNRFGYKGSRVYACCKNEWCLLGDLLYQKPPGQSRPITDWNPCLSESPKEEEDEGSGEGPSCRQLYRGCTRLIQTQEMPQQSVTRGDVVAVVSNYDIQTGTWTLGPQFKICLNDSLLRSSYVLGTVTKGMEVASLLSRMGGDDYGPDARITISDCGAL